MEDKLFIAIVVLFCIIGSLIYFFVIFYNESKKAQQSLKNELLDFKNRYDSTRKKHIRRFTTIDSKLSTLPNIKQSINSQVKNVVNTQKKKLEDSVENSFKQVGKDILFELIIDEHISKTISLQEILKGEEDKYTGLFNTLTKNMVYINDSTATAKNEIAKFKTEIQSSFDIVYKETKKYNENYTKGKWKAENFEKRISALESNSGTSSGGDAKSLTSQLADSGDTYDDFEFEVDKELASTLSMDEPKNDSTYLRYKGMTR